MRFKIYWASLIVGRKFAVSALFYFLLGQPYSWKEIYHFCFVLLCKVEGNFEVQAPGGLIFGGAILQRIFLCYEFRGLIFGRAYTWRGLFSEMFKAQKFFFGGGGLIFGLGIFWGFCWKPEGFFGVLLFAPHLIIPVTLNSEYPPGQLNACKNVNWHNFNNIFYCIVHV